MEVTTRDIFEFFAQARSRGIVIAEHEPSTTKWLAHIGPCYSAEAWRDFTADCFEREWVPGIEQCLTFLSGWNQRRYFSPGPDPLPSKSHKPLGIPVADGVPEVLRQLPDRAAQDEDFWGDL